jgi:hypothetical protein
MRVLAYFAGLFLLTGMAVSGCGSSTGGGGQGGAAGGGGQSSSGQGGAAGGGAAGATGTGGTGTGGIGGGGAGGHAGAGGSGGAGAGGHAGAGGNAEGGAGGHAGAGGIGGGAGTATGAGGSHLQDCAGLVCGLDQEFLSVRSPALGTMQCACVPLPSAGQCMDCTCGEALCLQYGAHCSAFAPDKGLLMCSENG